MRAKFVFDISSHGFGHAGQCIPVLAALHHLNPEMQLVIRTGLPKSFFEERLDFNFDYINARYDFSLAMRSALEVDVAASVERYAKVHAAWPANVAAAAEELARLQADALVSNVDYLGLAAAAKAGVPAWAFSSLNWADLFSHFCGRMPGAQAIHAEMAMAYNRAEAFFQPVPFMPMPSLLNCKTVGPLARKGVVRRREIARFLKVPNPDDFRLVVVSLGGIPFELDVNQWPSFPENFRFVVTSNLNGRHPQVVAANSLPYGFLDVFCSADALVTKPGYGMAVDAACNGIPVLYVRRQDWPEEQYIADWLCSNNRAAEMLLPDLYRGQFQKAVEKLWGASIPNPPEPTGAFEIAAELLNSIRV